MALFSFTHNVLQSPKAIDVVVDHLRPGGRVVAAGWSAAAWWLFPLDLPLWLLGRPRRTTVRGFFHPWQQLAVRVRDLSVERLPIGLYWAAHGSTNN